MFTFTVKPDGGDPVEVEASMRDVLQWEKTEKGKTFNDLQTNPALADIYRIAYIATTRQGHWEGSLADFESTCDIDVKQDEEPDPTQQGR